MSSNFKKLKAIKDRRNPANDMLKKATSLAICRVDGCKSHISEYNGPGSNTTCRKHQLLLREYGGNARLDRMWTFHKKDVCEGDKCGHDPMTNVRIQDLPYDERRIVSRMLLHVDHIDGDKSNNDPSNLQTLCMDCHEVKTLREGDYYNDR